MEGAILGALGFLENVDFEMITRLFMLGIIAFWIVVVGWVIFDAIERFRSFWLVLLSVLMVLVFNVFGLFIYLVIRPKVTKDDEYWIDLERRFLKFEASGLEDCDVCGCELMPNFVFCPCCGEQIRYECDSCEAHLQPTWLTCPFCGEEQKRAVAAQRDEKDSKTKRTAKKKTATKKSVSKAAVNKAKKGKRIITGLDGFIIAVGAIPQRIFGSQDPESSSQDKDASKKKASKNK